MEPRSIARDHDGCGEGCVESCKFGYSVVGTNALGLVTLGGWICWLLAYRLTASGYLRMVM
jgi:hypothetical protein